MSVRITKIIWHLCFYAFVAAWIADYASADTSLGNHALEQINDAVFEVVVPKPTKDSMSYDHPLPQHLIPYAVRTDKYYSIGTAFAIGPNKFVTAAHVMSLGSGSQFKEVCLRDKDGNVSAIDKITKYSEQRDFVVFSIKDKTAKGFFQVNTAPRINQKVFAVGNALGEGIVIRDGLYTSSTFEAEKGTWKWIRFSAAASPGNSGGPLLDTEGRVIGIVLQKSPNENLNIALPIAEVINAKENLAIAHRNMGYSLVNIRNVMSPIFNKEITLPKSYQELNLELIEALDLLTYNTIKELFKRSRSTIFPNGKGSDRILNKNYDTTFPNLIFQMEDGNWYLSYPKEIKEAELAHNGRLRYGNMDKFLFLYIQKPDNMPLETFYNDSKQYMDLLLKGVFLAKKIGETSSRLTSMGNAIESYIFMDSYERKWFVKNWIIEYSDEKVATFSLPVPGGCMTMIRIGQTGQVDSDHIPDMKILANFIYPSYYGTLKNWREFLRMKQFLPRVFSEININFEYGKRFDYHSSRLSFSLDPSLMNISENNVVKLSFNYLRERSKITWDVGAITVREGQNNETYISIDRKAQPEKDSDEKFQREWETVVVKKFPYNKTAFPGDKITSIATVLENPTSTSPPALYTAFYSQDGKAEQVEMAGKLDKLLRNLTVHEYKPDKDISHKSRNDSYHDNGEYFKALWDQISMMRPQTSDGYILRGNVYQDKGEFNAAIENYDKAIALNPEDAEAYLYRASANKGNGKLELALSDYNKAIEINPNLAEAYFSRGNLYSSKNEIERAIADYTMAIGINPNNVSAYVNRGSIYKKKGEAGKAFADYNKALDIDPMSAEAYCARGSAYSTTGESQNAFSDLNKALEINPRYAAAYNSRGMIYGRKNEIGLAIADFNASLELDSKNSEVYNNRGFTYKMKGDLDQALGDFDLAINLNPKFALAYINRGNTYIQKRDLVRACSDWKKACENGACINFMKAREKGVCKSGDTTNH